MSRSHEGSSNHRGKTAITCSTRRAEGGWPREIPTLQLAVHDFFYSTDSTLLAQRRSGCKIIPCSPLALKSKAEAIKSVYVSFWTDRRRSTSVSEGETTDIDSIFCPVVPLKFLIVNVMCVSRTCTREEIDGTLLFYERRDAYYIFGDGVFECIYRALRKKIKKFLNMKAAIVFYHSIVCVVINF